MRFILPAIVFAAFFFTTLGRAPAPPETPSDESPAPPNAALSPREKEELQGRIFMAKKQYPDAVQVYARLAQEYPKEAPYLNYLGIAQLQGGKLDDARKSFERATKVNRRFPDAYNNLDATYYAEKQY